jgi:hypothetical protein
LESAVNHRSHLSSFAEFLQLLVLHQLANQFGTVSAELGKDIIDVFRRRT